jgi:Tfp pilus assembly protein PilV
MIINSRLKISKSGGFGILEVLLAGVIIITMLGALVILGRTVLNNIALANQRMQATFLAQQGIETVRQIRDTNYIDGDNSTQWNSLVSTNSGVTLNKPSEYAGDFFSDQFVTKFYNNTKRTYLAEKSGNNGDFTTQDNITYTRTITFKKVDNMSIAGIVASTDSEDRVFTVTCTVSWNNGDKSISIDELITNSHPNF